MVQDHWCENVQLPLKFVLWELELCLWTKVLSPVCSIMIWCETVLSFIMVDFDKLVATPLGRGEFLFFLGHDKSAFWQTATCGNPILSLNQWQRIDFHLHVWNENQNVWNAKSKIASLLKKKKRRHSLFLSCGNKTYLLEKKRKRLERNAKTSTG